MAELEKEKLEEDYLDKLLNSVSDFSPDEDTQLEEEMLSDTEKLVEDSDIDDSAPEEEIMQQDLDTPEQLEEENFSFESDEEDIEQLLSMLNTEGLDDDLKEEDIDKIAEELEDIPDISEKEEPKKKKRKKLFGKKEKKEDLSTEEIAPEDNEQIIKSVEDSFEEGFDLSDLEGFGDDLADIEDRSAKTSEKTPEEKKAEKEQKKKEKAKEKAEKKKLKKEQKEQKKALKAEKKQKKEKEKPKVPEEKVKISIPVVILLVSMMAALICIATFGGKYLWYNNHIDDATNLLIDKKYSEAYESIAGLNIKNRDKGLYRQLRTLMYIQKEYDSYFNCLKIDMKAESLDSLLKGVEKYDTYKTDAEEYGVSEQASEIYACILEKLSSTFGLSESDAKELVDITDSQQYSKKIAEIISSHSDSIELAKNEAKEDKKDDSNN